MVMMPPTVVVASASAPSVMMASATAMAPTMAVATSDLDNRVVSAGKRIGVYYAWHCQRRQGRSERKNTGCKSDQQKPRHDMFPPWIALSREW